MITADQYSQADLISDEVGFTECYVYPLHYIGHSTDYQDTAVSSLLV